MESKTKAFEALIKSIQENKNIDKKLKNSVYQKMINSEKDLFTEGYFLGKNFNNLKESKKLEHINNLIYNLYNDVPYEQFNQIIGKNWIKNYFMKDLESVFDENSLKTIENYQNRLNEDNYMNKKTILDRNEDYITVKMEGGCIYGKFCGDTNNQKCVRGRVIKDLLELSNPKNSYRPILIKEHKHDKECEIRLKKYENVIDELLDENEMSKHKHIL